MKFRIAGEFETETIIALSQRITAVLQDAGVERVAHLNIYCSVVGRDGLARELERDGEPIDALTLDCSDLACPPRADTLRVARAPSSQRHRSPGATQRPTARKGRQS